MWALNCLEMKEGSIHLRRGKRYVSIPYSLEMNDTIAYLEQKVPPRQYGKALKDNFDRLYEEGAESGTIMCIPTHNYQVSCAHRIKAYEEALEYITGHSKVWVTIGREIASYFLEHYYDAAQADIASRIPNRYKTELMSALDKNYLHSHHRS